MAAGGGNAKSIGSLTLDISSVESQINRVNQLLSTVGAGVKVDLTKRVAKEVKKQLDAIEGELKKSVKDIQDAAKKATDAMDNIGKGRNNNNAMGSLQSSIQKVTDEVTTMGRAVSGTGNTIEKVISQTRSGYDSMGKKVREVADEHGNIVRKIYDEQSAYKEALKTLQDYYTKKAQMYSLEVGGKTGTSQYAKLQSEVNSLEQKWNNVDDSIKRVVLATQEAQRAAKLYNDTISIINAGQGAKAQEQALKNLVVLYQDYYKYSGMANTYAQKGDVDNADMYQHLANGLKGYIDAIKALNPALDQQAQNERKAVEAHLAYEATLNSNKYKEQTDNVNAYAVALEKMLNEQARFNQQVASGKLVEGSDEYKAAEERLKHLEEAAIQAGQKLDQAGRDAAMGMGQVKDAIDKVNVSMGAMSDSGQVSALKQVEDAYKQLTNAIRNYDLAKKAGNNAGMDYWKTQIDGSMQVVGSIEKGINSLNVDANTRQKILNIIEQCKTSQDAFTKGITGGANATNEIETQMTSLLTRMFGLMAAIRTISNLIKNTVQYVTEYYDKMNEIQIITQKSSEEVAALGERYREIAESMNVSSLDMADAAIYFTRQGLAAEEIERRLKNVTMYAKTANVEFTQASEIITAVVNSMGLVEQEAEDGRNAAQRVADVFLAIGDHAATSGQEIGEAMQKAAASAGAFGLSMEWLASYIATVSETTRQEARTIGTAFNTIIARLHQIKQSGYNSEDETKLNDIAKALARIDISLMDQNGEWRDMTDIFQEIGEKWGDLDGKTKSYIATTMAGVKQQNVFLALMNDLGKGIEGNSRAWELYNLAINSAGTAEEKYATYKDSVAASQERLNVAQEKFYALLDASVIKTWNNALAGIVDVFTAGTKALGGLNILLPITIGLIVLFKKAIVEAGTASALLVKIWTTHPIMVVIAGVAAAIAGLTGVFGGLSNAAVDSSERFDEATQALAEHQDKIKSLEALQTKTTKAFEAFGDKTELTAKDLKENNGLLEELCEISPRAAQVVALLKDGMISQKDAAAELNDELEKQIDNQKKLSIMSAINKYDNYQEDDNLANIQKVARWEGPYSLIPQYHEGMSFAEMLKGAYNYTKAGALGSTKGILMTDSLYKEIDEQLKSSKYANMDENEKWGYIGEYVWRKLFNTADMSHSPLEELAAQANEEIDKTVALIDSDLGPAEKVIAKKFLKDLIFGEDGEIDAKEYGEMSSKLSSFLTRFLSDGFDMIKLDNVSLFNYVGEEVFGVYFDMMFDKDRIKQLAGDPEYVESVAAGFSELMAAGFNNQDIRDIYENLDISNWDQAVDFAMEKLKKSIKSKSGELSLGIFEEDLETGESVFNPLMWDELDVATLKTIDDMIEFGVSIDQIRDIMANSESVDEFKEKLNELGEAEGYAAEEAEEARKSISELVKEMKSSIKEIDKIDDVLEKIANGEDIDFEDLMDLASAHPEILAVIGDLDALKAKLNEIKEQSKVDIVTNTQNMILDNEDVAKNSPFAENLQEGETLRDYRDRIRKDLGETSQEYKEVAEYIDRSTLNVLQSTGMLDKADKENIAAWERLLTGRTNMDFGNRKQIDAADLTAAGWEGAGEGYATLFSQTMSAGKQFSRKDSPDFLWNQDVVVNFTPILPNGKVMTPEDAEAYLEELFNKSADMDELFANDAADKGILISVKALTDEDSFETAMDAEGQRMELLHQLEEAFYGVSDAEKTWLETQVETADKEAELDWAKSNGFAQQIGEMNTALNNGGIEEAIAVWDSYDESLQKSIASTYPELAKRILESKKVIDDTTHSEEDATKATDNFGKTLKKTATYANPKYFKESYAAIQKLENGTISATDAFDTFNKELDTVKKANEDIIDVNNKLANKTEVTASDVSNLSKILGISADQILSDWPAAVAMFDDLTGEGGELVDVFNRLNEAAFIKITGTSVADFSELENGLISVQGMAEETIELLKATGQWETETINLPQEAFVWDPVSQSWNKRTIDAGATVLKAKSTNPLKTSRDSGSSSSSKKKRSGGGGGGGNNKDSTKNQKSDADLMLERMQKIDDIHNYNMNYFKAQQSYYETTGQLQGVISALQLERNELVSQESVIESNIKKIEKMMNAKKKQLKTMAEGSEEYNKLISDLDKLQSKLHDYTTELYENKTAQEQAAQAIKEQQDKIRKMEIDIQNLIYQAIQDRENKRKNMLNAEIQMENKVLEVIKKRYEKERDEIIETTNAKIDALNKEKELLDEQLQMRKEQEEKEDKQLKLAQLEEKYTRISADPTRQKEAQSIQKEISDLRKEMAWDAAEEEVKARQDSIDQQINSLEDYIQYVTEYYEDLFEHPQKLIEEMKQIMQLTNEEIIEWLKENDENYQNSSENTQLQLIESWEDTLLAMRGQQRDYWQEVYAIMEQGDEAIIEFLKEHREDYAKAGKLQAEAYVDEWKKMLDDLKKAQQQVSAEMPKPSDIYIGGDNGGSGGNSGGTGGSGGNSGGNKQKYGYRFTDGNNNRKYDSGKVYDSKNTALTYGESQRNSVVAGYRSLNQYDKIGKIGKVSTYLRGGIADFTGPAWLDGTRQDPERILSPYQTKLFETMVQALEKMSTISIPSMPRIGDIQSGANSNVSVGDIIVNVDNLDTDDDYEELAQKVSDVLMERIGRTAVVGGLRING